MEPINPLGFLAPICHYITYDLLLVYSDVLLPCQWWCPLCCVHYIVYILANKDNLKNKKKTFSALLALCVGNSPVTCEFPAQRPVTRSVDVFFDLRLNKRLSKQSRGWWSATPPRSLWRQCNDASRDKIYPIRITVATHYGDINPYKNICWLWLIIWVIRLHLLIWYLPRKTLFKLDTVYHNCFCCKCC